MTEHQIKLMKIKLMKMAIEMIKYGDYGLAKIILSKLVEDPSYEYGGKGFFEEIKKLLNLETVGGEA